MFLKKFIDLATLKFILVGIINTLIGGGIQFILLNLFNADYWISNLSNLIIGSIVSYFLNKFFTFKSKGKSVKEVIVFAINVAVCHIIAYGLAEPFVNYILSGQNDTIRKNIALAVGMVLFTGLNYLGQRFIVFKYKKEESK